MTTQGTTKAGAAGERLADQLGRLERHLAGLAAKTAGKADLVALEERLDARLAAMESRQEQRLLLLEARLAAVLRELMAAIAAPFPPA